MKRMNWVAAALIAVMIPSVALADGMIVPVRPDIRVSGQWAVKYHHVKITVRDQVANVSVDQEFVNLSHGMMEVEYIFPVPPEAAIDSMTLMVNGKEFAAKLLKADEARRVYESIVRAKKDPALLEYVGFGMLKTSAFPLEAGKPAKILVTYKSVCKKDRDLVTVWYPLNTEKFSAKAIERVEVKLDVESKADITTLYSPTHDLDINRKDGKHVLATYRADNVLPTTDFLVFYKEANEDVGATLLTHQASASEDGYFLMLVSPGPQPKDKAVPKDVLVVLDHSGSMNDDGKIDQAKEALRYVLKNLNRHDRFNVVAFNDDVEPFFKELVRAGRNNVKEALDRLDHIDATSGTNIHEALKTALKMWPDPSSEDAEKSNARPKYLIFLTDGRPTVGKTDEGDILKMVVSQNTNHARVFAFGVGYEVNIRLLDKLCQDTAGRSDYVKPKESVESKVCSLYAKIKNPVMTDLKVSLDGVRVRDLYPRQMPDLFEGDQIVLAGRYFAKDADELQKSEGVRHTQLVIKGIYEGKERAFEYTVNIQPPGSWRYDFVEKLWAMRRVGYLLDQIQLSGSNQELIDELVRLSKQYGIMTPYTSFLADERTDLAAKADATNLDRASRDVSVLRKVEGAEGQIGASNRKELSDAERPELVTALPARGAKTPALSPGAKQYGNSTQDYYERQTKERVANVQSVGNQAMYRRGNLWVTPQTANLDIKKDSGKIQVVKRFSDEYFRLARANTAAQNQVLSAQGDNEELLIELRGQAYLIK